VPGNDTLAGAPIYTAIAGAGEGNLMLTNARADGTGHVFSFVLNKTFDWGLDLVLGYAYTDVEAASAMTSFTGESSFNNLATNDINFPRAATSNYAVKDRVTLRASFAREFWGDNTTRFTLQGYYATGQPGSYTMHSDDAMQVGTSYRHLLYIPDGPDDPNVVYTDNFLANDADAFWAWVNSKGLKPGFVERNSRESRDNARFDIRIDQEIPLGMDDLKARVFFKIYNFTNLLNDDWGHIYDAGFYSQSVVSLDEDEPLVGGAYNYDSFSSGELSDLQEQNSLWTIRLGVDINFR